MMLGLVLAYSTPIQSLHNCSNLNHSHESATIENTHAHCYLCDLQFHSFLSNNINDFTCFQEQDNNYLQIKIDASPIKYHWSLANKGPPSNA